MRLLVRLDKVRLAETIGVGGKLPIGFLGTGMTEEAKKTTRTCPDCGTVFGSVADLGQCPKCKKAFRASKPVNTSELNVHGRVDPDWPTVAPLVERLRLVDRTLPPNIDFPRLRHLALYGRVIDQVEGIPDSLHSLKVESTSVLDLSPLPGVARLSLSGSRYCVTHGFGPRVQIAPGFEKTCRDLIALNLDETWVTDSALAHVVGACRGIEWLSLGRSHKRPLQRVDLSSLGQLEFLSLSDLHAHSVSLPESVRVLDAFRAHVAPLDLSGAVRLEELSLSYTGFADEALKTLPQGVPLRRAQLDYAGVTGSGLAALARAAPHIEHLNIASNDIGDDDLECLRAFPKLRELSIRDTRVTPDGTSSLDELDIEALETDERELPGSTRNSRRIAAFVSTREAFFGRTS